MPPSKVTRLLDLSADAYLQILWRWEEVITIIGTLNPSSAAYPGEVCSYSFYTRIPVLDEKTAIPD